MEAAWPHAVSINAAVAFPSPPGSDRQATRPQHRRRIGSGSMRTEPADASARQVGVRVAIVIAAALAVMLLTGAVRVVDLITPGGQGPSAAVIREDFGPGSVPEDRTGYDGQQFYAIARDFPDLKAAAQHLDAPRYRLLRIAAPAVASLGGTGTPVVLLLVAINVAGAGLACWALAVLCADRGWSPSLGSLAVVPVIFGIVGSTADPISLGLGLAALVAASRGRHGLAIAVFILAALTREQVAAMSVGAAAGLFVAGERRWLLVGYAAPVGAVVGWYLILGTIVGGTFPDRFDWLAMFSTGAEGLIVALAALAISFWGAWAWRSVPVAWPVALGFGLWIFVYFHGTFDLQALPRTTAPSLALGLAALGAPLQHRLRPGSRR